MKNRNLVQKHALNFQRSDVFKDKKKANKRGYSKHKKISVDQLVNFKKVA